MWHIGPVYSASTEAFDTSATASATLTLVNNCGGCSDNVTLTAVQTNELAVVLAYTDHSIVNVTSVTDGESTVFKQILFSRTMTGVSGFLMELWTGTLPQSGSDTIRIQFVGISGNTGVSVSIELFQNVVQIGNNVMQSLSNFNPPTDGNIAISVVTQAGPGGGQGFLVGGIAKKDTLCRNNPTLTSPITTRESAFCQAGGKMQEATGDLSINSPGLQAFAGNIGDNTGGGGVAATGVLGAIELRNPQVIITGCGFFNGGYCGTPAGSTGFTGFQTISICPTGVSTYSTGCFTLPAQLTGPTVPYIIGTFIAGALLLTSLHPASQKSTIVVLTPKRKTESAARQLLVASFLTASLTLIFDYFFHLTQTSPMEVPVYFAMKFFSALPIAYFLVPRIGPVLSAVVFTAWVDIYYGVFVVLLGISWLSSSPNQVITIDGVMDQLILFTLWTILHGLFFLVGALLAFRPKKTDRRFSLVV